MDTVNESHPHYCRAYFQKGGKSENFIPVSLVQGHFQYQLKLLKNDNVRDREITIACPSDMQATTTARALAREGTGKSKSLKTEYLPGKGQKPE